MSSYDIYIYSCLLSEHELIAICGIYMAFEGYICGWHIYSNNIVINSYNFLLACSVIWGPYVDCSSNAGGHVCDVTGIFVQRHMPEW